MGGDPHGRVGHPWPTADRLDGWAGVTRRDCGLPVPAYLSFMPEPVRIADLPPRAFAKADPSPDADFYAQPRMVAHIDEGAIAGVGALYAELIPHGARVLDLMSSRYSHLPEGLSPTHVTGHGMNADELAANPALDDWFVRNLNEDQSLPLDTDGFDAAACCVSVQYLQHPVAVFAEVARVLRPGSPFVATYSNRCFPTKAVAIWQSLPPAGQAAYLAQAMEEAGMRTEAREVIGPGQGGDPLWAVVGRG